MRNQNSRETYKASILNLMPRRRAEAIQSRELMTLTGLTFREIKDIITELRIEHPICAKETEGGGYWIAETDQDILEFVNMIERRRDGHNHTISVMTNHMTGRN